MTPGFYKLDGELLYAPNFVLNANYELRREVSEDHAREVDGWRWFDSIEEACAYHNIDIPSTEIS